MEPLAVFGLLLSFPFFKINAPHWPRAFRASQTQWHLNGTHSGLACCVEKADKGEEEKHETGGEGQSAIHKELEDWSQRWGSCLWWNSDFIEMISRQVLDYLESPGNSVKSGKPAATKAREKEGEKGRRSSELSARKWGERNNYCLISLISAAGSYPANFAM